MLRNKCKSDDRQSEYYTVRKESFSPANMSTCFRASPGSLKRKMKFPCQSPHSFWGKAGTREILRKRATRVQFLLHQSSAFLPFPQLLCGALKVTLQKSVTSPSMIWAVLKLEPHLHQDIFVWKEEVRRCKARVCRRRILLMLVQRVAHCTHSPSLGLGAPLGQ